MAAISFSGLASGLDTSSWITALTALKQAKVTKLETQKAEVVTAQSTLNTIKSYFNEFRSKLEKITDTNLFKNSSLDLFAKKLAVSANPVVANATTTSDAIEGSYDIKVSQLASKTKVNSGYRYQTTLVQTTTATSDSYLKNISKEGVNTIGIGEGDLTIAHDGVTSTISIEANETIRSLLHKFEDAGITATYLESSGTLCFGVGTEDITGVLADKFKTMFNLVGVNHGYETGNLQLTDTTPEYHVATSETLLSELGVGTGTVTIQHDSGDTYTMTIGAEDTIGSIVTALNNNNINASFADGIFQIRNAYISDDGTTDLINKFGLTNPEYANVTQSSENGLSYQTIYTTTTTATLESLVKDIEGVEGIDENHSATVVVQNLDSEITTIDVTHTMTIDDLCDAMEAAGLTATLENGVLSVGNGRITGGSLDVENVFGLEYTTVQGMTTGTPLSHTVTSSVLATEGTALSTLGVTAGVIDITDSSNQAQTITISNESTIGSLLSDIRTLGLGATFDSNTGVITLTGGGYSTPVGGSNALTQLFGASELEAASVGTASAISDVLQVTTVSTVNATGTTTLAELGYSGVGNADAVFTTSGGTVTVSVNGTMSLDGLAAALVNKGIDASFDTDTSKFSIEGATYTSGAANLDSIMNFTEKITGRYVTSTSVVGQTVTVGEALTSSGVVYHTIETEVTVPPTTSTVGLTSTSGVIGYETIVTTTTTTTNTETYNVAGTTGTYGVNVTSGDLSYQTITTAGLAQTGDVLTYQTVGTTGIAQTGQVLAYETITPVTTTVVTTQTSQVLTAYEVETVGITQTSTVPITYSTSGTYTHTQYTTEPDNLGYTYRTIAQTITTLDTMGIGNYSGKIITKNGIITINTDGTAGILSALENNGITVSRANGIIHIGAEGDENYILAVEGNLEYISNNKVGLGKTFAYEVTYNDGYKTTVTALPTAAPDIQDTYTTQYAYNHASVNYLSDVILEARDLGYTTIGIGTADQLAELADIVNDGDSCSDLTFVLTEDIDLSGISNWTAIGNDDNSFEGTFDGQGHKISNLTMDRPTDQYQGLFGYIENATIKNLGLENINITGGDDVGGLVGWANHSTITNCYTTGTVIGDDDDDGDYTGGLIGAAYYCRINNCYSGCEVISGYSGGGFAGNINFSTITDCYSTGNVGEGSMESEQLGGFAYNISWSTITNCYSTGDVDSTGYAAGFAFESEDSKINRCYTTGSASGGESDDDFIYDNSGNTVTNSGWVSSLPSGMPAATSTGFIDNDFIKTQGNIFVSQNTQDPEGTVLTGPVGYQEVLTHKSVGELTEITNAAPAAAGTYAINTTQGLVTLLSSNNDFAGYTFVLGGDIDMDWVNYTKKANFAGSIDGNGYAIKNLHGSTALFGSVANSTIKDLKLENVNITNNTEGVDIAALADSISNTTIENVLVEGNITGAGNVSGLVNQISNSTVKNVTTRGNITSTAETSHQKTACGLFNSCVSSTTNVIDSVLVDANITSSDMANGLVFDVRGNITVSNVHIKGAVTAEIYANGLGQNLTGSFNNILIDADVTQQTNQSASSYMASGFGYMFLGSHTHDVNNVVIRGDVTSTQGSATGFIYYGGGNLQNISNITIKSNITGYALANGFINSYGNGTHTFGIENVTIEGNITSATNAAAGFMGNWTNAEENGYIRNVSVSGTVKSSSTAQNGAYGFMVEGNQSGNLTLENCSFTGAVISQNDTAAYDFIHPDYIGNINIVNCHAIADTKGIRVAEGQNQWSLPTTINVSNTVCRLVTTAHEDVSGGNLSILAQNFIQNPTMGNITYAYYSTFQITTTDELIALNTIINTYGKDFSGKTIILGGDIDMSEVEYIAQGTFKGTFDGNGYTISGLGNEGDTQGLFYNLDSATVRNLNIAGTNISATREGGILGYNATNSTIENVFIQGALNGDGHDNIISGLLNTATNTSISNTHVYANLEEGADESAGFISYINEGCSISDSSFTGYVETNNWASGFAILIYGSDITNCSVTGTITGCDSVGFAYETSANITNCSVKADVIGSSFASGFSNEIYNNVSNCSFEGTLKGPSVYEFTAYGNSTNCVSKGKVLDLSGNYIKDFIWSSDDIVTHNSTAGLQSVSAAYNNISASGTYRISTTSDLLKFKTILTSGTLDQRSATYILGGDIDMSNAGDWNVYYTFKGTFDGNGYTISNLHGTSGLFHALEDATVKDLTIDNASVTFASSTTDNVGLFARGIYSNTLIENVHIINGHVENQGISSNYSAAGFVGYVSGGTVKNCTTEVEFTGTVGSYMNAGFVGTVSSNALIQDSKATVKQHYDSLCAGFIKTFSTDSATIKNCHTEVDMKGCRYADGFAYVTTAGAIIDSTVHGYIDATNASCFTNHGLHTSGNLQLINCSTEVDAYASNSIGALISPEYGVNNDTIVNFSCRGSHIYCGDDDVSYVSCAVTNTTAEDDIFYIGPNHHAVLKTSTVGNALWDNHTYYHAELGTGELVSIYNSDTIQQMIDKFAQRGINITTSKEGNTVTGSTYIEDMSTGLKNLLGLSENTVATSYEAGDIANINVPVLEEDGWIEDIDGHIHNFNAGATILDIWGDIGDYSNGIYSCDEIADMSDNIAELLHFSTGYGQSYTLNTTNTTATLDEDTQLFALGLQNEGVITLNNNSTVTVNEGTTIGELISELEIAGVTANLNANNTMSFGEEGDSLYITNITDNLDSIFGFDNTTQFHSVTFGINTTTIAANVGTTFGQLGLTSDAVITISDGSTITVTSGTTFGTLVNNINSKNVNINTTASENNHQLILSAPTNSKPNYITNMSPSLANILGIAVGEGDSYSINTTTVTATSATTMNQLGLTSDGTITLSNGQTINVTGNTTLGHIITQLSTKGVNVNTSQGNNTNKVKIDAPTDSKPTYITGITSRLANILGIDAGYGESYTTNTETVSATRATTLESLGMSGNTGTITLDNRTITVNKTDSLATLISRLNSAGVSAGMDDNKLYIDTAGSGHYIKSMSSNLSTALGIEAGYDMTYTTGCVDTQVHGIRQLTDYYITQTNFVESELSLNNYQIVHVTDSASFTDACDNSGSDTYIVLDNDIDFEGREFGRNTFEGVLNGNGHTISNINTGAGYGLFETIDGGIIKNLTIDNAYIEGGGDNIGIIAKEAYNAVLDNVSIVNSEINIEQHATAIGGMIGSADNVTIKDSSISSTYIHLENGQAETIGGMIGTMENSTILNSASLNNSIIVSETASTDAVGGVVGRSSSNCSIQYVESTGMLEDGGGSAYLGGIVGFDEDVTTVNYCKSDVWLSTAEMNKAGAITGYSYDASNMSENFCFDGIDYSSSATVRDNSDDNYCCIFGADGTENNGLNYFVTDLTHSYIDGLGQNPAQVMMTQDDFSNYLNNGDITLTGKYGVIINNASPYYQAENSTNEYQIRLSNNEILWIDPNDRKYIVEPLAMYDIELQYSKDGVEITNNGSVSITGISRDLFNATSIWAEGIEIYDPIQGRVMSLDDTVLTSGSAIINLSNNEIITVRAGDTLQDVIYSLSAEGVSVGIDSDTEFLYFGDSSDTVAITGITHELGEILGISAGYGVSFTSEATNQTTSVSTTTTVTTDTLYVGCTNSLSGVIAEARASGNTVVGIGTADELAELATIVNGGDNCSDLTFALTNDIDLSGISNWTAIGTDDNRFQGTFDGQGYKISNLTIDRPNSDYMGLFGYIENAAIKNIGLENIDVTGGDSVGGLAGCAYSSTITNCYTTGTVVGDDGDDGDETGGLIGEAYYCRISNCYSGCEVISGYSGGGFAGYIYYSTITNCYSTGNVGEGSMESDYLGGFAYYIGDSTISNCYSTGDVDSTGYAAGFAYDCYNSTITQCYTTGSASGGEADDDFIYDIRGTNSITNSDWVSSLPSGMPAATSTGFIDNNFDQYQNICTGSDMTLEALGVQFPAKIFANLDGRNVTLNITNTSITLSGADITISGVAGSKTTVSDVVQNLSDLGLDVTLSNSQITINSDSDNYITNMSTSLAQALKLEVGEGFTYGLEVEGETTEAGTAVVSITAATTFGDLGLTSDALSYAIIRVMNNGTWSDTYTISTEKTVGDFLTFLNSNGMNASLTDGVVSISPSSQNNYITYSADPAATNRALNALKLGYLADARSTIDKSIGETQLKDLQGLNITSGDVYVYKNGVKSTINISNTMTVDDLADTLANYNIQVLYRGHEGTIRFVGDKNSYMESAGGGSNILTKLGITNWNTEKDSTSQKLSYTEYNLSNIDGNSKITEMGVRPLSEDIAAARAAGNTVVGIGTAGQLAQLADIVNNGDNCSDLTFVLTNDIDLSGISNWTPIGAGDILDDDTVLNAFSGTFDGQGHVIRNMSISNHFASGLFGLIDGATIKNLGLENSSISGNFDYAGCIAAGAAGESTILNCYVSGASVTNEGYTYELMAGGIIGICGGTIAIENCWSNTDINSSINSNSTFSGGLIGLSKADTLTISNSYASGNITSFTAGGLIGASVVTGANINNCWINTSFTDCVEARSIACYADGQNFNLSNIYVSSANSTLDTFLSNPSYTANVSDTNTVTTNSGFIDTNFTPYENINSSNITAGKYTVVSNGVTYTGTISANTTVNDFFGDLAIRGISANISSDGRITIGASNNTYLLASNGAEGYSNIVETLFPEENWTIGNIYTSNTLQYGDENVYNADRYTKLADIGEYTPGKLIINHNGVDTELTLGENETIGNFLDTLTNFYGFTGAINANGQVILRSDGSTIIKTPETGATNVETLLGLDFDQFTAGEYVGQRVLANVENSSTLAMDNNAKLSDLGVTTGEYYIYSNGHRYTETISANDTLGDLRDKLNLYGIRTDLETESPEFINSAFDIIPASDIYETSETTLTATIAAARLAGETIIGIGTAAELAELATVVNNGDKCSDLTFVLTNDIDLSAYSSGTGWTAIGTVDFNTGDATGFSGTFDGQGHVIRNLTQTKDDTEITGLFGIINNATIKNVGLENINITGYLGAALVSADVADDGESAGNSTISNCYVSGGSINTGIYTAGIIGLGMGTTVENCWANADITGARAGSIAGTVLNGNISDSYAYGNITLTSDGESAGGIAGGAGNTSIDSCYFGGTIMGEYAGSIAGASENLTVTNTSVSSNNSSLPAVFGQEIPVGISDTNPLGSSGIGATITLRGDGESYIAASDVPAASNVVDVLFGNKTEEFNYTSKYLETTSMVTTTSIASLTTTLSDYDADEEHKSTGTLAFTLDGSYTEVHIEDYDTFGSVIDKFKLAGLDVSLDENGKLKLMAGNKEFTVDNEKTTSHIMTNLGLNYNEDLGNFCASSAPVMETTSRVEDRNLSAASYADMNTKLALMNISSGSLSVYRDGRKALIQIDNNETLEQLNTKIKNEFDQDVYIEINNGKLRFASVSGAPVQVGSSIDTSNISAICAFTQNNDGTVTSEKELYKVNASSKVMEAGIFRHSFDTQSDGVTLVGDVTEGAFTIGDAVFTINSETTIANIISQINASEKSNASAYWDSIDGKLIITSRTTGAALVNVQAGDVNNASAKASNFTDLIGLTNSEFNPDGTVQTTRLLSETQNIGTNAKFSINGTSFASTTNTIKSDVSRIQGLTLNLKNTGSTTINIEADKQAVSDGIQEFVDAYNDLIENIDLEVQKGGTLSDQYTLKNIRNEIRNLMTNSFSGNSVFRNLAAIGISTTAASNGNTETAGISMLYFDSDKFINAYSKDPDSLKALLVGTQENKGVLLEVENVVKRALDGGSGYFSSADKSYSDKISKLNEKISKANKAVEAYRARLEAKFQSMDMLISQMQQQYNSFLQQSNN